MAGSKMSLITVRLATVRNESSHGGLCVVVPSHGQMTPRTEMARGRNRGVRLSVLCDWFKLFY